MTQQTLAAPLETDDEDELLQQQQQVMPSPSTPNSLPLKPQQSKSNNLGMDDVQLDLNHVQVKKVQQNTRNNLFFFIGRTHDGVAIFTK